MEAGIKTYILQIEGMTCKNCQNRIAKGLRELPGVKEARVSYRTGAGQILYDPHLVRPEGIAKAIGKLGYTVVSGRGRPKGGHQALGFLLLIAALYILTERLGLLNLLAPSRLAESGMSYGMLFIIGLMTSVHCLAMCGGINLSQSITQSEGRGACAALYPSFLYNLGRVVAYTTVGFAVGAAGSVFSLSNTMQGVLKLVAGLFMVIMGINMLGIFPWLRRFTPSLPGLGRLKPKQGSSPLVIGLLNGLMPCGPLQAMQLYALSTGSAVMGALSMLLFSLGTVPLMLLFGAAGNMLSRSNAKKLMSAGAVLVAVLGLSMLSQGASLAGLGYGPGNTAAQDGGNATIEDGVQVVRSTLGPGRYPAITVQYGMPVKWIIDAPPGSINGCNNRIFIPEYGIEHTFQQGENIITFTPEDSGQFPYSCWMGMIRSRITVT